MQHKLAWFNGRRKIFLIDWGLKFKTRQSGDCFIRAVSPGEEMESISYTETLDEAGAVALIEKLGIKASCGQDVKRVIGLWVDGTLVPFKNPLIAE